MPGAKSRQPPAWATESEELFTRTGSRLTGLTAEEAAARRDSSESATTVQSRATVLGRVVLAQVASPLVLCPARLGRDAIGLARVDTVGDHLPLRRERALFVSTVALVAVALAMPYIPGVRVLGFAELPMALLLTLLGITIGYVMAVEALKYWFYRRYDPEVR